MVCTVLGMSCMVYMHVCVHASSVGIIDLMSLFLVPAASPAATPTEQLQSFVAGLVDLPESAREELQQLTPWTYVGNAAAQAKQLAQHLKNAK